MSERVLRRDRRRIWILGIFCVIAWMLVVMLPWATTLPVLAKIRRQAAATMNNAGPSATTGAMGLDSPVDLQRAIITGVMATFFDSIAAMFLAAICTVSLIVLSRRATLRQVNARLGEISAQIRAMGKEGK